MTEPTLSHDVLEAVPKWGAEVVETVTFLLARVAALERYLKYYEGYTPEPEPKPVEDG
jgi:hypothetical protein